MLSTEDSHIMLKIVKLKNAINWRYPYSTKKIMI